MVLLEYVLCGIELGEGPLLYDLRSRDRRVVGIASCVAPESRTICLVAGSVGECVLLFARGVRRGTAVVSLGRSP
jgi:hypothetical protein